MSITFKRTPIFGLGFQLIQVFLGDSNWQKDTIITKWLHISAQAIVGLSLSKSEEMYGQIIYCYQFPQE